MRGPFASASVTRPPPGPSPEAEFKATGAVRTIVGGSPDVITATVPRAALVA